jgi:hypothetical protein
LSSINSFPLETNALRQTTKIIGRLNEIDFNPFCVCRVLLKAKINVIDFFSPEQSLDSILSIKAHWKT